MNRLFQQITDRFSRIPKDRSPTNQWDQGIESEVKFWDEYLRTKGGAWPTDFEIRCNPTTPLQSHITEVLDTQIGGTLQILDVGAGPLTYLGKLWEGRKLVITAIDPLASEYDRLLARYQVHPPVRTQKGFAESLLDRFGENMFDLVHARNCIDHCKDPCLAIKQMVAVTKIGGTVYMHHAVNEAESQHFQGFHQWNLQDRDGDLFVSGHGQLINMTKLLSPVAQVENRLFDGGIWMVNVLRKH